MGKKEIDLSKKLEELNKEEIQTIYNLRCRYHNVDMVPVKGSLFGHIHGPIYQTYKCPTEGCESETVGPATSEASREIRERYNKLNTE